ncbi:MAG: hypothetical protein II954_06960 [Synergistaceae bacterium]|nr:hypothetical protein [Synergistaceae bacterium]
MTSAVLEKTAEYIDYDYELDTCGMDEAMAEVEDILAHPEKYKRYTSVKDMFRDIGIDVSGLKDY